MSLRTMPAFTADVSSCVEQIGIVSAQPGNSLRWARDKDRYSPIGPARDSGFQTGLGDAPRINALRRSRGFSRFSSAWRTCCSTVFERKPADAIEQVLFCRRCGSKAKPDEYSDRAAIARVVVSVIPFSQNRAAAASSTSSDVGPANSALDRVEWTFRAVTLRGADRLSFAAKGPRPVEGVLHATQREPRVLTNQSFCAHSIARLNGARILHARGRPRITTWFRRGDNRGRRGESDGLNTIERELKHRAFRECDESLVKSQIQFAEACHLLDSRRFREAERSRRFTSSALNAAGWVELRGIGDSPCRQTRRQTLQRSARLDRVRDILLGEKRGAYRRGSSSSNLPDAVFPASREQSAGMRQASGKAQPPR